MDGRPSMEKAKAIKEKRDLAKELGKWHFTLQRLFLSCLISRKWYFFVYQLLIVLEDVRAFEQSVAGRHPSHSSSRIKSGAGRRIVESESEGNGSDQNEHEDPLSNRKVR